MAKKVTKKMIFELNNRLESAKEMQKIVFI